MAQRQKISESSHRPARTGYAKFRWGLDNQSRQLLPDVRLELGRPTRLCPILEPIESLLQVPFEPTANDLVVEGEGRCDLSDTLLLCDNRTIRARTTFQCA